MMSAPKNPPDSIDASMDEIVHAVLNVPADDLPNPKEDVEDSNDG